MKKVNRCPMCKSGNLKILKKFKFFYLGEQIDENLLDARYVRLWILFEKILKHKGQVEFYSTYCKFCGFIFLNPRFTSEEMSIKYATINELGSVKKRLQKNPASNLDVRSKRIYSLVTSLHEAKTESLRVLDYGGASGYNLIPFVENGSSCYILDYERWELPKGIEYLGKDPTDLRNDVFFDLILCLHTLEHAVSPMNLLQGLSNHLSESGLIYVEVPLGCFREYKDISEPLTHVNFFSEESLYKAIRSVGLNVVYLSTAYQWVTHGNGWCMNIIGSNNKDEEHAITLYKTTRKQMSDVRYYPLLIVNKMHKILSKLFHFRKI